MEAFKIPPIFMFMFLYVNFILMRETLALILLIVPLVHFKHPLMLFKHLHCFLSCTVITLF